MKVFIIDLMIQAERENKMARTQKVRSMEKRRLHMGEDVKTAMVGEQAEALQTPSLSDEDNVELPGEGGDGVEIEIENGDDDGDEFNTPVDLDLDEEIESMGHNKKTTKLESDELHCRVSEKLVDGYTDVYLPVVGDDMPVGVRHDPEGDGVQYFEKVQVKSSKGDLIPAWKKL